MDRKIHNFLNALLNQQNIRISCRKGSIEMDKYFGKMCQSKNMIEHIQNIQNFCILNNWPHIKLHIIHLLEPFHPCKQNIGLAPNIFYIQNHNFCMICQIIMDNKILDKNYSIYLEVDKNQSCTQYMMLQFLNTHYKNDHNQGILYQPKQYFQDNFGRKIHYKQPSYLYNSCNY